MNLQVLEQRELHGKKITVYGSNENPLFLAKDVSEWIEHSNTSEMIKNVDEDEKLMSTILISGQNREAWTLTENGLYEVLMQSRKPIAKEFKKGVKNILKEIRLKGGYIATTKDDTDEMIMAKALRIASDTIERVKNQNTILIAENEKLDMKTQYINTVFQTDQNVSLSQTTKLLKLPFGRNTLCRLLREKGVFFQNSNEPKQSYCDRGYFKVFANFNEKAGKVVSQTFVTQKGLAWIAKTYNIITPKKNKIKFQ